jgi:alginate O-acetyltransferase complex protein AlgI
LLSGLWHGPNWTFVVWGAYHGFFLVVDKLVWLRVSENFLAPARVALTFLLVMIGWVFFRADSIEHALGLLNIMFSFSAHPDPTALLARDMISNRSLVMLIVACLVSFAPEIVVSKTRESEPSSFMMELRGAVACILLFLSAANLTNSQFHPFIYFKF